MELAKLPLGFALESAARCKIPHGILELRIWCLCSFKNIQVK
jgi:hypothetical protein